MNRLFTDILCDIEFKGSESQPRDLKVKEAFVKTYEINPYYPIADFQARPFNWKYFAGELAWYMMKDNDIEYISQFSSFWKRITNPNSNEINSNYGSLLFGDQLKWVIDTLLKDPNSRQAIAFLNRPQFQFEGNKDFVCTMYLNFWVRDNKLNMKVQMRSNDVFYGLTYDAPFFAFVLHHMAHELNSHWHCYLAPGTIYHSADNIHFYEQHFELAQNIRSELTLDNKHRFYVKLPLFDFDGGTYNITPRGREFIEEVNFLLANEGTQEDYKKLIYKFLHRHY